MQSGNTYYVNAAPCVHGKTSLRRKLLWRFIVNDISVSDSFYIDTIDADERVGREDDDFVFPGWRILIPPNKLLAGFNMYGDRWFDVGCRSRERGRVAHVTQDE